MSLPSRERGLKSSGIKSTTKFAYVAPFAGAWIEMHCSRVFFPAFVVAPFAGVWIEISVPQAEGNYIIVAPFAGAWIEIHKATYFVA